MAEKEMVTMPSYPFTECPATEERSANGRTYSSHTGPLTAPTTPAPERSTASSCSTGRRGPRLPLAAGPASACCWSLADYRPNPSPWHDESEGCCNPTRRHSALGMISPHDYETRHTVAETAA